MPVIDFNDGSETSWSFRDVAIKPSVQLCSWCYEEKAVLAKFSSNNLAGIVPGISCVRNVHVSMFARDSGYT